MRHTRNTGRLASSRSRYRISSHMNPLTIANLADAAMDPRRQRTRAALSAALLSLLQEKAYEDVTIRAVTKRARISYPTFFSHYDSVRGIMLDLVESQVRQVIDLTVPAIQRNGGPDAAVALCTFVDQHRGLWTALLTGGAAGIVRAEFTRQASRVSTPLTRRHWLPRELANGLAVSAIVDILIWWLQRSPPVTVDEAACTLHRLVGSSFVRGRTLTRNTRGRGEDARREAAVSRQDGCCD